MGQTLFYLLIGRSAVKVDVDIDVDDISSLVPTSRCIGTSALSYTTYIYYVWMESEVRNDCICLWLIAAYLNAYVDKQYNGPSN